jgi:hypothetical protein
MGRRKRRLLQVNSSMLKAEGYVAFLEDQLAACPDAAQYADEVVGDFLSALIYLDWMGRTAMVKVLQQAGIAFPPELAFDKYRLGWHVLRKWLDPDIREAALRNMFFDLDYRLLARLKRSGDALELQTFCRTTGSVLVLSIFRTVGMSDLIPKALAALSPDLTALHRAAMTWSRLELHRITTGPEPARLPSRWEQQKLLRRIHLRNVQLRSMGRNLHALRQERKALLTRLRESDRREVPELDALAWELEEIRAARATAERQHEAALAEQARRCEEELAQLRTLAASAAQDYKETLAGQPAWATVTRRD